jgi:hypothetical protein
MEHWQLLAGLALGRLGGDDGSGPPPAVAGHEADRRRAARGAAGERPATAAARSGARVRLRSRRGAPAPVT